MSGVGREPVATNGCFGDVETEKRRSERRAALEKPEGLQWVGLRQPTLRIHRQKADFEGSMPGSGLSPTSYFRL